MAETEISLWFLAFFQRDRERKGAVSTLSPKFTCLLDAENEMTREKMMYVLGRTSCS